MICPIDRHILFDVQVPGCLVRPAILHKASNDLRKR